jgi:hypothetical protein
VDEGEREGTVGCCMGPDGPYRYEVDDPFLGEETGPTRGTLQDARCKTHPGRKW